MNSSLPTRGVSPRISNTPAQSHNARAVFRRFAGLTALAAGSPWAFVVAVASIVIWALVGPKFHYSDTWQLVINTGTTIVTFLMVFLIQNTQNRDAQVLHLKLDELIRGQKGARNVLMDLEHCTDEEIESFEAEFKSLREKYAKEKANEPR